MCSISIWFHHPLNLFYFFVNSIVFLLRLQSNLVGGFYAIFCGFSAILHGVCVIQVLACWIIIIVCSTPGASSAAAFKFLGKLQRIRHNSSSKHVSSVL
jgi:hypothetical protein